MRDILNDLESGKHLSDADPVKRAQKQMRSPLPRRFYEAVTVSGEAEGHAVRLDGKAVRTPASAVVTMPTEQAARLVADEYAAQGETIDPTTMPVTRLVNTAIDGVASDVQAVAEDILRYASSDLLFYRADGPERLVQLQSEAWDPVLDWVQSALGARFILAEGVIHVEQPRETIAALGAYLRPRSEPLRIAALHVMATLTGSALLALAVDAGAIDAETAWKAAHVDEDWNIAQWGEDAEATARRALKERDMRGAAALLAALEV